MALDVPTYIDREVGDNTLIKQTKQELDKLYTQIVHFDAAVEDDYHHPLLSFFKSIKDIRINKLYILPSGDSFRLDSQSGAIAYKRKGSKEDEHWEFDSSMSLIKPSIRSVSYDTDGWKIGFGFTSTTLPWYEICRIFDSIGTNSNYIRKSGDAKPTGGKYAISLTVKKK